MHLNKLYVYAYKIISLHHVVCYCSDVKSAPQLKEVWATSDQDRIIGYIVIQHKKSVLSYVHTNLTTFLDFKF